MGRSRNPTGCPKGAHHIGRPSNDIRQFAREIIDKYEILETMAELAINRKREYSSEVQLKAMIHLLDRAYGRPSQEVRSNGGMTLEELLEASREEEPYGKTTS